MTEKKKSAEKITNVKELPSEILDVEVIPIKPKITLLRKAIWINTWFLLGLAAASNQLSANAAATVSVDTQGNVLENKNQYSSRNDLEVSEEYEIEEYSENYESSPSQWEGHQISHEEKGEGIIVVATVDGSIAGLSRHNGELVWKQNGISLVENDFPTDGNLKPNSDDSSKVLSPLVSTTTTTTSSNHDWRTAAVPSVDGRIFLTAPSEMTATSTVKELVTRAPFVDARGRFYVGSREATAVALDKESGEILRVVSGGSESINISEFEDRKIIWVGRVDYSMSLFDARTGVIDVKFSSSEIMGVQDMMVDDIENPAGTLNLRQASNLMLPGDSKFEYESHLSLLVATPNGNIGLRDPITGSLEWVNSGAFNTPIAFALESSTGTSLRVDIVPDAPDSDGSHEYIASQIARQIDMFGRTQGAEETIVGALPNGQLYAMPLGKRLSKKKSSVAASVGLPHSIYSSALAIGAKAITSKVPNLGRRPSATQSHHSESQHAQGQATLAKKACGPKSQNFPACLVGSVHKNQDSETAGEGSFLDNLADEDETAVLPLHEYGYNPQNDSNDGKFNMKHITKLMGSWLPPTMALLFVLSFEMGRRLKAKKEDGDTEVVVKDTEEESKGGETVDNSGAQKVGVITVSDSVLGFGGHGTVVYRGELDGRQVAVKRMLKAYHASADREISLLIESDGHPNVVRYFLKEVKGDFVYLALELCEMSLHDLALKLRQHAPTVFKHSSVMMATKELLYQIACGVRHLHSLRIVHRDLKPANILLAMNNRNTKKGNDTDPDNKLVEEDEMISRFKKKKYLAKISDMGLGKQLVGQSSYGLSMLGTSSIPHVGESSRLTGAGPGSVGWQAPEVMAIRWSSETASVKSNDNSQNCCDSFMDGSPIDLAMNSRPSRSVDIFSLGCIFHCTLMPGIHPFGDWFEREANIMRNKPITDELREISPEAHDLVTSMICRDQNNRPTAKDVCQHPFFWSSQLKLAFLCDFSDRIESDSQAIEEGKDPDSQFGANVFAIEKNAADIVGTTWDKRLHPDLISNVSKFRSYDPSSLRDCLRLIRNKHHHYDELPTSVKLEVGSNPEGLFNYFEYVFPRLLMHCYSISREFMEETESFMQKYSITCVKGIQKSKGGKLLEEENKNQSIVVKEDTLMEEFESSNFDTVNKAITKEITPEHSFPSTEEASRSSGADDTCCSEKVKNETEISTGVSSNKLTLPTNDIVIWEGSTASKTFNCRGWCRGEDEWNRGLDANLKKHDSTLSRCSTDTKFRTRLCNHWDVSLGTFCPMRKKKKCIFAHGPIELRVKEGKKNRWGKLVDKNGNNSNPRHSGGEDTYGAARSIETMRKDEGKWNTNKKTKLVATRMKPQVMEKETDVEVNS
mmetsp:Transcript_227/g.314  ORF Transcript_227/g.314 Transcript_227/m.314 type:complete len:1374 (+) Transcript_227:123-4244(+)|eukprot:CAMPEP_0194221348 /NCGR_PEP_ID=MMETSP0156-20130528/30378_1 /TAXON_ID=33649 /ORGANISM="Thalassionema nitzschioides, Strain L26-B" /LENGTH=1373 /DNA_ID=CAMNT_0038951715 /DNA_START=62 /DNA_END=4183 /DNA_ORIENTATION=+